MGMVTYVVDGLVHDHQLLNFVDDEHHITDPLMGQRNDIEISDEGVEGFSRADLLHKSNEYNEHEDDIPNPGEISDRRRRDPILDNLIQRNSILKKMDVIILVLMHDVLGIAVLLEDPLVIGEG